MKLSEILDGPHRDTITVVTAAVVLLGTMVAFAPGSVNGPDQAALEYFDALQSGDIHEALQMTEERQSGAHSFITPEVGTGEWNVESTEVVSWDDTPSAADVDPDDDETAVVGFTIAVPGQRDESGTIAMSRDQGASQWTIAEQLTWVTLPDTPMLYDEVNGKRIAQEPGDENEDPSATPKHVLLPGVYTTQTGLGGLAKVNSQKFALFPSQDEYAVEEGPLRKQMEIPAPTVTLTKQGQQRVAEAVDARVDKCVKETKVKTAACPFAVSDFGVETGDRWMDEPEKVSWKVVEDAKTTPVAGEDAIQVADQVRGIVKLRAEDEDSSMTTHCDIVGSRLQATFEKDGSVRLADAGDRFGKRKSESDVTEEGTCEGP